MKIPSVSRRGLLKGLLAAGVVAPLASKFAISDAHAATAGKVMFVYVPDGCIPSQWHPKGTESNFTLPAMSSPLESIKKDCVFLEGLNMYAGGATHEGGVRKVLTGVGDLSLDVWLGQQMKATTPFASLHLGVASNFQNGSGSMSFIGPNQEVKADDNPINAFNRVFGAAQGQDDAAAILKKKRDASVLDASMGDLNSLKARLGAAEKGKLDIHLESMRELERRIQGLAAGSCKNVAFNAEKFAISPTDYYPKTYEKEENFKVVGKLQMDLAVAALACGMTRVASLMWSHPVSPTRVTESTASLANHDASHYGDAASGTAQDFIKLKKWFMDRFVYLIEAMRKTPDGGGGTLLDNTLVVLCTELGDSNLHDHRNMPFVIAGGKALGLKTGRYLNYTNSVRGENQPHTKMLVSIAKAMGQNVDSFGYTGHGTGGLDGLFG